MKKKTRVRAGGGEFGKQKLQQRTHDAASAFTWSTKNENGQNCDQPCDNIENSQHYKGRGRGTKHEREEIHERNNGPAVKHQQQ